MIARLAAEDDSLGSTTVAVLSLLYIGPAFGTRVCCNSQLAQIVAFQETTGVRLGVVSS